MVSIFGHGVGCQDGMHSDETVMCQNGESHIGTNASMGPVPIWGYKVFVQFQHWTSSFSTGRPVSALGTTKSHF
jgi:hypothetical protein